VFTLSGLAEETPSIGLCGWTLATSHGDQNVSWSRCKLRVGYSGGAAAIKSLYNL
jgi:hypothetical protein